MGMYIAQNEGAKFWLSVLTELQCRSLEDIMIASLDDLKGFPEKINAVFPVQQKKKPCLNSSVSATPGTINIRKLVSHGEHTGRN